jgi:hypothetical protein
LWPLDWVHTLLGEVGDGGFKVWNWALALMNVQVTEAFRSWTSAVKLALHF